MPNVLTIILSFYQKHSGRVAAALAVILAGLAGFYWGSLHRLPPDPEILTRVGSHRLALSDLDRTQKGALRQAASARYWLLEETARRWLEQTLLETEARARGVTVKALLEKETAEGVSVTDKEVYARYVRTPGALSFDLQADLKAVAERLQREKTDARRRNLIARLNEKHGGRLLIEPPDGYRPPPDASDGGWAPFKPPAGAPEGAVVWEVYSDFLCPYSGRLAEALRTVKQEYGDKLHVVYRHFPLAFHKGADLMAEASLCAREQDQFWPYHDALYAKEAGPDKADLIGLAKRLKLDAKAFERCLESGRYRAAVQADIKDGRTRGVEGTPGSFVNGRPVRGVASADLMRRLIDWYLNPKGLYPGPRRREETPKERPASAPAARVKFTLEDLATGPSLGPADAPVTLVEFVDFHCPFCRRGAGTVAQLMQTYAGRVRLVQKQFPLPIHPQAVLAAVAGLCAEDQGKFWEFRERMFGEDWNTRDEAGLVEAAKKAGVDVKKFRACLESNAPRRQIEADKALGSAKGVRGTPTFFINGHRVVGARPVGDFEKLIDAELAQTEK